MQSPCTAEARPSATPWCNNRRRAGRSLAVWPCWACWRRCSLANMRTACRCIDSVAHARRGIELQHCTLMDWVAPAAHRLAPLVERIAAPTRQAAVLRPTMGRCPCSSQAAVRPPPGGCGLARGIAVPPRTKHRLPSSSATRPHRGRATFRGPSGRLTGRAAGRRPRPLSSPLLPRRHPQSGWPLSGAGSSASARPPFRGSRGTARRNCWPRLSRQAGRQARAKSGFQSVSWSADPSPWCLSPLFVVASCRGIYCPCGSGHESARALR